RCRQPLPPAVIGCGNAGSEHGLNANGLSRLPGGLNEAVTSVNPPAYAGIQVGAAFYFFVNSCQFAIP
ncbi:MAG: hypothetical protein D6773_04515, partial [Alphaproteobacteria bacterium]